jgi:endonuclease YncB( thermonuclease family)
MLATPGAFSAEPDRAVEAPPPEIATVLRVYDGDTLTIHTGDPVRLRWINTPEMRPLEPFAEEAREVAASFVAGKQILLAYADPIRDGYGRLIADVVIDGVSLEAQLLARGLGHVMLIPPVEDDLDHLFEAQKLAREARLGIWSDGHYQGTLHITSFHANGAGNDRADPNVEYLRVCNITEEPLQLKGYSITNARNQRFSFPEVIVPAGHTVKVHSGKGVQLTDPHQQLEIFLGSDVPLWNNTHDLATIWDAMGQKVDWRLHEVQGN